jgi:hypothetical protein
LVKNGSAETNNTSERARRAWRKPHPWTFWPRDARTNREHPPDFINIKVEELVGDRPFDNLDDYITQDELRRAVRELQEDRRVLARRRRGGVGP